MTGTDGPNAGQDGKNGPPRLPAGVVLLALLVVALVAGAVGVGAGSDMVSIFEYAPEERTVEPGEETTVDIELSAGGAPRDIGVDRVNATLVHDPEALTVTALEPGPWLAAGDADIETETDIDDRTGTVRLVQTRRPPGEGATGSGTLLTVTLAVAGGATPGNYTLTYGDTEVRMVNGHYQPTFTHSGSLVVTDGADDNSTGRFALGIATLIALGVLTVVSRRFRGD